MPKRELPKSPIASFSIWKTILYELASVAMLTFLSWGLNSILHFYKAGVFSHPLTVRDILLVSGWVPISLWARWAWQPRRKHARWHRWLGALVGGIYLTSFILLGGIAIWNTLLPFPWNWIVNSVLVVLFVLAWVLPSLSYRWSKKLADAQDVLGLRMLAYGGPAALMVLAGTMGASFGMNASRNDEGGAVLLVMGFLISLVVLFLAQYNANELWPYRPWAKEDK